MSNFETFLDLYVEAVLEGKAPEASLYRKVLVTAYEHQDAEARECRDRAAEAEMQVACLRGLAADALRALNAVTADVHQKPRRDLWIFTGLDQPEAFQEVYFLGGREE